VPPAANAPAAGNFGAGPDGASFGASSFSAVLTSVSPAQAAGGAGVGVARGKTNSPQPAASVAQKSSAQAAQQANHSQPTLQPAAASSPAPPVVPATPAIVNLNPTAANMRVSPTAAPTIPDSAASGQDAVTQASAGLSLEFLRDGISTEAGSGNPGSLPAATIATSSGSAGQLAGATNTPAVDDDANDGASSNHETAQAVDAMADDSEPVVASGARAGIVRPEDAAAEATTIIAGGVAAAAENGGGKNSPGAEAASGADQHDGAARAESDSTPGLPKTPGAAQSLAAAAAAATQTRGESRMNGFAQNTNGDGPAAGRESDGITTPDAGSGEISRNIGVGSSADLQKAISDTREKLVQQIDAHLQAELSAAPAKTVGSAGADTAAGNPSGWGSGTGANGNLGGQSSGDSSSNTSAQDAANQEQTATPGAVGIRTGISADAAVPNAAVTALDPTAAVKTLAQPAAVADATSAHAAADASLQTIPLTPASPAASPSASGGSANIARPVPLPEALPQSLNDVVKASELYQGVGGSEMHIAMQTDLLGAVDLRAAMHQSTLTATISVQRSDVQALLANELPNLQHALADKNYHVEQIAVLNNSVGGRSGSSGGQQPAQQQNSPAGRSVPLARAGGYEAEDSLASLAVPAAYGAAGDGMGRISVHV
jgi:Flagellar hook-length control protein FliK